MSSFRDIATNIIPHDTLLGRSMYHPDDYTRAMIEMKTDFFLRSGGGINSVPMGASADSAHLRAVDKGSIGGKIAAQSKKANTRTKAATEINRNKRNVSGHQNLVPRANGKYLVSINSENLGIHEKLEALKVRDQYRAKNNLPAAEY